MLSDKGETHLLNGTDAEVNLPRQHSCAFLLMQNLHLWKVIFPVLLGDRVRIQAQVWQNTESEVFFMGLYYLF